MYIMIFRSNRVDLSHNGYFHPYIMIFRSNRVDLNHTGYFHPCLDRMNQPVTVPNLPLFKAIFAENYKKKAKPDRHQARLFQGIESDNL